MISFLVSVIKDFAELISDKYKAMMMKLSLQITGNREDAEGKEAYYYNQTSGVQMKPMEVRDNTAIYSESDVIKILQFYKDQLMEKADDK